jgi:hypothetical protein
MLSSGTAGYKSKVRTKDTCRRESRNKGKGIERKNKSKVK